MQTQVTQSSTIFFAIRRSYIPDDLNKEGKGLMGIGAVISAQIVNT